MSLPVRIQVIAADVADDIDVKLATCTLTGMLGGAGGLIFSLAIPKKSRPSATDASLWGTASGLLLGLVYLLA
jgi:hypothetical protein